MSKTILELFIKKTYFFLALGLLLILGFWFVATFNRSGQINRIPEPRDFFGLSAAGKNTNTGSFVAASDAKQLSKSAYVWQSVENGELAGNETAKDYLGFRFSPDVDGYISELCGFFSGTKPVDLYDSAYNLLASASVTSYERWNCARIAPVPLRQGRDYYVVGEMDGGPYYYRLQDVRSGQLPKLSFNVFIKNGVMQPLSYPFGSDAQKSDVIVFGMVDVKFTAGVFLDQPESKSESADKEVSAIEETELLSNEEGRLGSPPTVSAVRPSGTITAAETEISVRTDQNAFCRFCAQDLPFSKMCNSFNETGFKRHNSAVGPLAVGEHIYFVRCRNATGNEDETSTVVRFTVKTGGTPVPFLAAAGRIAISGTTFGGKNSTKKGSSVIIRSNIRSLADDRIKSAEARVANSDGKMIAAVMLFDDGLYPDIGAGDGVYAGLWRVEQDEAGKAVVDIAASDGSGNFSIAEKVAQLTIRPSGSGGAPEDTGPKQRLSIGLRASGGTIDLLNIGLLNNGFPQAYAAPESGYLAEEAAADGTIVASQKFVLPEADCVGGFVEGFGCLPTPANDFSIELPYYPVAKRIDFYDPDGKMLFNVDVLGFADRCGNGICEKGETQNSCPGDCRSGIKDDFCDGVVDGTCDPDCTADSDSDCRHRTNNIAFLAGAFAFVVTVAGIIKVSLLARRSAESGAEKEPKKP